MVEGRWLPWQQAWQEALYGTAGFYRRELPGQHFRTSLHGSDAFAAAVLNLAQEVGATRITDLGAGGGELLAGLRRLDPCLELTGVELRPRPRTLDATVGWRSDLPEKLDGLVLANELLDNLPCPVVEADEDGRLHLVEVETSTGQERLGPQVESSAVEWCTRWWPLGPGERAEIGLTREAFWANVCSRASKGLCAAIDYGHVATSRPALGTLTAYRQGRQVAPVPDGTCDITAHVAVDALAEAVGGEIVSQREILTRLGVTGRRPDLELASTDPPAYVHALSQATAAAQLIDSHGLGDFTWVLREMG